MLKGCPGFAAAMLAALAMGGSSATAQETNTVGNPQLRDFQLPGATTQPAPPPPQTLPATPPTTPPPAATPPAATTPPATTPPPTRVPPAGPADAERTRPAPAREAPRAAPAEAVDEQPAATADPEATAEAPAESAEPETNGLVPAFPSPAPEVQEEPAAPIAEASRQSGVPWLYLGLAALAALLAFIGLRTFLARRREAEDVEYEPLGPEDAVAEPEAVAPVPAPRPQPKPAARVPAPEPKSAPAGEPAAGGVISSGIVSSGTVGIQVRPWIELEFKPDRAVATDTDTSVQFELIVRNTGNTGARNVRIEGRMFNAGAQQEQEIGAFFADPRMHSSATIPMLLPQAEGAIRSMVSMPRNEVREITLEGRRLFVPMVAFNVTYEWGESRSGQTSMSYLVGREAETPSEKMGAFRLDLGPRLYRSVGQRQTNLALIV